jgi:hypothetical protein
VAGFGDHVVEQKRARTLAEKSRVGAHGFQFSAAVSWLFEGADGRDIIASPGRPDRNVGGLKAREVEREDMAGRGAGVHAGEMQGQELAGRGAGEVVLANVEHLACHGGG